MAWAKGLEGPVLNIVTSDRSPLRVMAGPGTGKSFSLQRRVARLLDEGTNPSRILAVTFTRNAAANLVEDLYSLGIDGCDKIRVGTLHAFCYSLLMRREVLETVGRVPRPIISFPSSGVMQFEGAPLLADIMREIGCGTKRDGTKAVRAFEAAWARLQSEEPGWAFDHQDQLFNDVLLGWLEFHQAILIGELVPLALNYLRNNPACEERRAFDHILVDEFQDLNKAEQVLIGVLAESCNQFVLGDPDQSIYSFRYARPEGIIEFGDMHAGTHDEALIECRRCPTRVVEFADHLIHANYPKGSPPKLQPFKDNRSGEVAIVQWEDLESEAKGIADFCRYVADKEGYDARDILILCPRRIMAYGIRDALKDVGMDVHSYYHEESLESLEAQKSLALLTLFCEKEDRVALRYWLGLGSDTWHARGYANLRSHCEENGQSPFEVMHALSAGNLRLPHTKPLTERFSALLQELHALTELKGAALLDWLYPPGEE